MIHHFLGVRPTESDSVPLWTSIGSDWNLLGGRSEWCRGPDMHDTATGYVLC